MARKMLGKKRKKVCYFCVHEVDPSYKDIEVMKHMVTDRGKIFPKRMTGVCAKHQRKLATAIKRARNIALLPFVAENMH